MSIKPLRKIMVIDTETTGFPYYPSEVKKKLEQMSKESQKKRRQVENFYIINLTSFNLAILYMI